FQEADIMGITTPITKHNYQVRDVGELPRIIKEAFHIATSGRPGPVLIDIPKDISANPCADTYESDFNLPGYQPKLEPNPHQVKKLAEALAQARKPVILAGAGVQFAKASRQLIDFVEKHQIPVVNTLQGLETFPGDHKLFLGMSGMHEAYSSNNAHVETYQLINII